MSQHNTKKLDCVGIGLSPYDFALQVPKHPQSNSKNVALQYQNQGGGPVPNALAVLAQLECRTALVTTMGDDIYAERVLNELKSYNIDVRGFRRDGEVESLQSHIIVEAESGRRTVVLNTNKIPEIRTGQVPEKMLGNTKFVHLDSRPSPAIIELVRQAKDHGALVMLDAGSVQEYTDELLPLVDYPILSNRFVKDYYGHSNVERACREICEFGATIAGITMGAEGSYLSNDSEMIYIPAFEVDAVDTTGAGDLYHGGLLFGILHDWSLKAAGQFASAVAAIGCQHFGARSYLPDIETIKDFLLEHGITKHPVLLEQMDIFSDANSTPAA